MDAEVFFLYLNGAQKGPYTVDQVNHLHRCGLVDDETPFWREGLPKWQPLRILLDRKPSPYRWIFVVIGGVLLLGLALFFRLFGGITADAWREMSQTEFTEEAAYYAARGMVRTKLVDSGLVEFSNRARAEVKLGPGNNAVVTLVGKTRTTNGSTQEGRWRVVLHFSRDRSEWKPGPEPAPTPPPSMP
jgi:hypothetical protein